jgi:tetratricopeptide (TPR) repeat protein
MYSTLKPYGGKILVGDLIPGRHRALLEDKWVQLEIILAADQSSPYYNEKAKASSLYNEGWALTHMLCFRNDYRPKFGQLLRTISEGKDSAVAFSELYGKTVGQIEKDLQAYLRGSTFQGSLVTAKLDNTSADIPAEPLADFDTGLMLADLAYRPGKEAEHQAAMQKLIAQDPKRPEPYRNLGYLAWRAGKSDEAREQFGKAFERGDRDPKMLLDYARFLESKQREEAIRVLSELLAQDGSRLDVRLELADMQVFAGHAAAALTTLGGIHAVTPADAPRFFRVAVQAHIQNGDQKDAEETAKHYKDVAKTDADRATAGLLIGEVAARFAKPPAGVVVSADTGPPTLRHANFSTYSPAPRSPRPPRPSTSGQFVELDCRGKQARMIVDTGAGRKVFLIDDPGLVIVTGQSDWQMDMTCGPQKTRAKVDVGYEQAGTSQTGVDGVVRTLAFK